MEFTTELRELIKNNPTLDIKVFASDEANTGEWQNEDCTHNCKCYIQSMADYEGLKWANDEDELRELIEDDHSEEFETEFDLNDELFDAFVDSEMKKYEFKQYIIIQAG